MLPETALEANMTAQGSVVVRLPRAGHGEDPSFVLLQVSSAGSNPLDVNLVGTENSTLFSAKLRHNQIATLKTSKVSQDEWENVLLYILLGIDAEGNPTPTPEDIEAVAKIDSTSMTISIQKNIEGITQKLGIITLAENENAAGDLYEWCGSAVLAKDSLMNYLQSLKAKFEEKDAQIKKLEESLAEMAQMKHENETQLLQKFSLLLNEKKLKIRDQQRLLQSSKVDAAAVKEMEETRLAVRSRPAGASRKGKRKAAKPAEEEDEEDEDLVKMKIDNDDDDDNNDDEVNDDDKTGPDSDQELNSDAETADEATASEDEDDEPFPPTTRKSARVKAAVSSQKIKVSNTPEPVSKPAAATAKTPVLEGSETEDEDDEL
ncbi:hypothetical protein MBM_05618 [Drepanopeziza brunnea f. sp. 'multigermtubi' MB_m1]|uniref:Mitotic apparatus protein p62 n=1 Tax=Marssonina brunnea f. sp. multigermtubi (strain MB_m1) TaxID=1072389 RepID=K1XUF2_MARBU|nr:uncharacterized protein MBM_05618 [Drepanopeziza brunnea f. sp. 'multigermtubi' MB_m1]EKD16324.1 hypothetical protein MBM_05618 [Drepanopeziza brunnea f. sp. 'multigermtubi' MB_m1]